MRESVRDVERLCHILEQIDTLIALVPELTFDTLDEDKVRYWTKIRHADWLKLDRRITEYLNFHSTTF